MKKLPFILMLLFCFTSYQSKAHEIRPAYLQIIQITEQSYDVYWKVPSMGDAVPRIQPVFPKGFTVEVTKQPNQIPGSVIYYFQITSEGSLQGKEIFIQGLNKTLTFDLSRIFKIPMALCSNDAKSCYDRILHIAAALGMRHVR